MNTLKSVFSAQADEQPGQIGSHTWHAYELDAATAATTDATTTGITADVADAPEAMSELHVTTLEPHWNPAGTTCPPTPHPEPHRNHTATTRNHLRTAKANLELYPHYYH